MEATWEVSILYKCVQEARFRVTAFGNEGDKFQRSFCHRNEKWPRNKETMRMVLSFI